MNPMVLTVAEVARLLKITAPTVRVLIKRRRLHAVKIRRVYRVPADSVKQFLKRRRPAA